MIEQFKTYWVGVILSSFTAVFTYLYKKLSNRIKQETNEQKCLKSGVTALLRDRLIQACNYYLEKGYCPIYGRENIDGMFKSYHDLGGNGTIKDLVDEVKKLPYERTD